MVNCVDFDLDFPMWQAAVRRSLLCKNVILLKNGWQKVRKEPLDGLGTIGNIPRRDIAIAGPKT